MMLRTFTYSWFLAQRARKQGNAHTRGASCLRVGGGLGRLGVVLLGIWALAGCGTSGATVAAAGSAERAQIEYLEALDELSRGNYPEAISLFQQVAKAPRYVKWSAMAQLRVGDALFFQSKYAEAAQQYLAFISQNEGDPNLPHASYMMGRAYYEQVPSDWFLTPPAYENDRQALERCRQELRAFMRRYPRSRFLPEVREMLAEVEAMQYGFNAYVADYYERRDKPAGVVVRLEHMMASWPEVAQSVSNFEQLAQAYEEQELWDQAIATYERALTRHPYGEHVGGMSAALETLKVRQQGASDRNEGGASEPESRALPPDTEEGEP